MKESFTKLERLIDDERQSMVKTLADMIAIKAVSPESGGTGEGKRADFLQRLLISWGLRVRRYDYFDEKKTKRPNLVAKFGDRKRTVWLMTHMDTVAEGDRSLWKTDPFRAKVTKEKVFGRGTNDNGQSLISSLFALKAVKESGVRLKHNIGVVFTAGEETGSMYGAEKLIKEKIFNKDDLFVVPDFGVSEGNMIETSEKGALWIRITITGKQVHASTPQLGKNAYREMIEFLSYMDAYLHKKYNKRDPRFSIPSTFEMTKHEKNVDSVNIIPGKEVSYIDCRILPCYDVDAVLRDIEDVAKRRFAGMRIRIDAVNKEGPAGTSEKSEVVRLLKSAIKELRGITPRCIGIGGGTDGRLLRMRGMQVAVWSTQDEVAHSPDEYAVIKDMVADSKVFAYLCV